MNLLAGLSRSELAAMAAAGDEVARLEAAIEAAGNTPVQVLTGGAPAAAFRHYPAGDVYDFASHAQFYYHTHRDGEHGHAHLFLRPKGMPPGVKPAVAVAGDKDAPCHLVAVGFGADGWLAELFTTNRWVSGEAWYAADAVKAMLPRFHVAPPGPVGPAGRWLTALVALFRPLIGDLADRRDATVAAWSRAHPEIDPLEDPDLEITSRAQVSVEAWRAAVAVALSPSKMKTPPPGWGGDGFEARTER